MSSACDPLHQSLHGKDSVDLVKPFTDVKVTVSLVHEEAVLPPILRPPTEILSLIFEAGSQNDKQDFGITVSHVCTLFRRVAIHDTPTIWNHINYKGGKASYAEITARLERSKAVPLDIQISNITEAEHATIMLNLLYPHLRRWRSLSLDVWETEPADIIVSALVDEAPRLETLLLKGYSATPADLFKGKTPRLQTLSIKSMSLDWKSSLFDKVTDLYIHSATFNSPSILEEWQNLRKLTIRADSSSPLRFDFERPTIVLPDLEILELNGVSEEDIVSLLSFVEMPNLQRLLFTHIKDSVNLVFHSIFPLPRLQELRLHATEMCQDNLLRVLNKVRNLKSISFEDSSPIPSFIEALSQTSETKNWVIPEVESFRVIAFEKDNAHRVYDDSDIYAALGAILLKRETLKPETKLRIQMCIFEGERNEVTRHATDWDVERPYMSVRNVKY